MTQYYQHFPVLAVFVLFLGAFCTVLFGTKSSSARKIIAILSTGISLVLILLLVKPVMIDGEVISYWFGNWEPVSNWAIGIGFTVDQLSLFFGLIVSVTVFLSALYSLEYMSKDDTLEKYYVLFLMLSGSVLNLVLTGDLFNMFVMIEVMTFASVALIAFRNKSFGALEASFKYIVIGSIGSTMILLGTVTLYSQFHTLNIAQIAGMMQQGYNNTVVLFAFAAMISGYCVKSYVVPTHVAAPDAYQVAPSSISMAFSGMVNKVGVYGIIRLLYTLYQTMDLTPVRLLIVLIGTITMLVGVTQALVQHDFKRLLAFHSISQIGYVITAIGLATPLGLTAGLYHAMNHTVFKGLLFLCAGAVLYSAGTTDLDKLGGLAKKMPKTAIVFLIGAFSISGLPPFNGFVSKWFIYQATYEANYAPVTIIALLVSVMTLASFIKVTQSVFFGQLPKELENVKEVPASMRIPMYILATLCVALGLFPTVINNYLLRPAVTAILNVGNYVSVMMGKEYAQKMFGKALEAPVVDYRLAGYWNPMSWLILFGILLIAFAIVALAGGFTPKVTPVESENEDKYAIFYSGEKNDFSQVGGSDLFWGLKHELRHYFGFMHGAHSGVINDYALYVVTTAAIIMLYAFAFVH